MSKYGGEEEVFRSRSYFAVDACGSKTDIGRAGFARFGDEEESN